MDRRSQADRDPSNGSLPTGQTSRGYPSQISKNPKNASSRRSDVIGRVPGDGGEIDQQTTRLVDPSGFPGSTSMNTTNRGNAGTIPDPATINRGYSVVTGENVPQITKNTGANRQNFGIDPGTPPQPDGDTTDSPRIPRFGTGTD